MRASSETQRSFTPPAGLANGHLQSILASSSIRRFLVRRPCPEFLEQAQREILVTPDGVQLEAWLTHNPADRGVALLFHGWEGNAEASYILETGSRLHRAGFHVIRLNFRDHGETHSLNEGLFHSCRLDEIVDATELVGRRFDGLPLLLAGYSLGGNFALRVSRVARVPIRATVAVSPVIDPNVALRAIENAPPLYHAYFMRKWRRSLKRKNALFPHRYEDLSGLRLGLRDLTAWMVERYTDFPTVEAYLDGYTIGGGRLADLAVDSTIIAAADDPVIPIGEFHALELPANVQCMLQPRGGHCGFIENWRLESWAARYITERFEAAVSRPEAKTRTNETVSC